MNQELKGSSAATHTLVATVSAGETSPGGPGGGPHPTIDSERNLILGDGEWIVQQWQATHADQRQQNQGDEKFRITPIAIKSNVDIILTSRRLVVSVPEEWAVVEDMTGGVQRANPLQRVGLRAFSKVMQKVEGDSWGPSVEAGHVPLESLYYVCWDPQKRAETFTLMTKLESPTDLAWAMLKLTVGKGVGQEIAEAVESRSNDRWMELKGDVPIEPLLGDWWTKTPGDRSRNSRIHRAIGSTRVTVNSEVVDSHPNLKGKMSLVPGQTLAFVASPSVEEDKSPLPNGRKRVNWFDLAKLVPNVGYAKTDRVDSSELSRIGVPITLPGRKPTFYTGWSDDPLKKDDRDKEAHDTWGEKWVVDGERWKIVRGPFRRGAADWKASGCSLTFSDPGFGEVVAASKANLSVLQDDFVGCFYEGQGFVSVENGIFSTGSLEAEKTTLVFRWPLDRIDAISLHRRRETSKWWADTLAVSSLEATFVTRAASADGRVQSASKEASLFERANLLAGFVNEVCGANAVWATEKPEVNVEEHSIRFR